MPTIRPIIAMVLMASHAMAADNPDKLKVGRQPDGSVVVPTNQILTPAGTQVEFPGRPVDLIIADNGNAVVIKNMRDLTVVDLPFGKIRQVLPAGTPGRKGGGFSAVGLAAIGDRIFVSDTASGIRVAKWNPEKLLTWEGDGFELKTPEAKGGRRSSGAA